MATYTSPAPNRTVVKKQIGVVADGVVPVGFLLKVDGVLYPTGYIINYSGKGYQRFFISYINNVVYLSCETMVFTGTIADVTLSNVEVLVIA